MAEPGNPRRSKLNWYSSLRGADLTPSEFRILVLLLAAAARAWRTLVQALSD